MSETTPSEQPELQTLKAELVRLRIKRSETEDADIAKALDERIAQLEAQMPAPAVEEEAPVAPPTAEQLQEAEQLIRQSRVEKMRKNARGATDLLKKAAEVAPGSPTVLEALGDDLMERRQVGLAKDAYRRASKLDPKNVGLERKFAMAVNAMGMAGSIEDQLRANLSDSPFITQGEALASGPASIILSALLPGLGHVVIGRKIGFLIMAAWVGCFVWAFLMYTDIAKLVSLGSGGKSPNLTVLVPIMAMGVIYLGTLGSLKSAQAKVMRRKVDHPIPPVNKPFEL